jgi:hypothetical protein
MQWVGLYFLSFLRQLEYQTKYMKSGFPDILQQQQKSDPLRDDKLPRAFALTWTEVTGWGSKGGPGGVQWSLRWEDGAGSHGGPKCRYMVVRKREGQRERQREGECVLGISNESLSSLSLQLSPHQHSPVGKLLEGQEKDHVEGWEEIVQSQKQFLLPPARVGKNQNSRGVKRVFRRGVCPYWCRVSFRLIIDLVHPVKFQDKTQWNKMLSNNSLGCRHKTG